MLRADKAFLSWASGVCWGLCIGDVAHDTCGLASDHVRSEDPLSVWMISLIWIRCSLERLDGFKDKLGRMLSETGSSMKGEE